jgi:hypothetical protein
MNRERCKLQMVLATHLPVVTTDSHCDGPVLPENSFVWETANRWKKWFPAKGFISCFDASSEASLCHDFECYFLSIAVLLFMYLNMLH